MKTKIRCVAMAAMLATAGGLQAQTRDTREPVAPPAQRTYIVQLAAAPLATYDGTVRGLAATRSSTGARLNTRSSAARAYTGYLDRQRSTVLARVGAVNVLHTYNTTFSGFAAQMTEAQAAQLMTSGEVKSVVPSERRELDTTRTSEFLGLTAPGGLYSQLDAQSRNVKGEDVIIGVIDSGIWPESPAFGDKVDVAGKPVAYHQAGTLAYGPPPAGWAGACVTGEGFTAAMCGNKLIGARYYNADFAASGAVRVALEYLSPRDGASSGHGSHTASTSGGNERVEIVNASGVTTAVMGGIAPRARIAAYKVCWTATVSTQTGCYTADMLRAIDDAVADGVDVINFSISGTQLFFNDPIEIAYLNATAAGVFVAASAGNSGPGNQVAHMSPWLTTVAASTHDRNAGGGDLRLGNGTVLSGFSLNYLAATTGSLVLSENVAAAGQATNAATCLANSLDAALASGRIVVCDRGTNTATARLAASAEVKRVGGIGMVLLNPTNTTLVADAHTVPTVHLQNTDRDAVRNYVAAGGATGTISLAYNRPGVVAPVMAGFSSRGPNKANGNILKPDITAPGVAIIAANRPALSTAQRDAVVAGTLTPPASTGSLQGTSMSSPHVAGAAALLRQLYPSWSPSAIKSALTTSNTDVKLSNNTSDTNRWGYGAGHLAPNPAAVPSLVYDASAADYSRFLCGVGLAPPPGLGSCATLGSIKPWNLNLSSLTAAGVVVSRTLTRTVTNVGPSTANFVAQSNLPGWNVVVTPASLNLAPGASGTYTAKLTRTTAPLVSWTFGSLGWSDGVRTVTSPLSAQALAFASPEQVSDARTSGKGSRVFPVETSYTGSLSLSTVGLVPAVTFTDSVATSATRCYSVVVPAGTEFARFQTFNTDTQGGALTDLDMDVFRSADCTGTNVGTSAAGGSDEVVTLEAPIAATYSVRITGYATPAGGAAFTLSTWAVAPGGVNTLLAKGPSTVYEGGSASVAISWAVPAGQRYMGLVRFSDGTGSFIGSSKVLVDNR